MLGFYGRKIGDTFLQKTKRCIDLRWSQFDLSKYMILQAIYELTGLYFGTRLIIMPDLA